MSGNSSLAEAYDFVIDSDGAGSDGHGGAAAITTSLRFGTRHVDFMGSTATTVPRMEMEGLLLGLRRCSLICEERRVQGRPSVLWMTDAQHLANFVNERTRPHENKDLAAAYQIYTQQFQITSLWQGRDDGGEDHKHTDQLSRVLSVTIQGLQEAES